jgi:uncharacterized protein (DUF427 family)
MRCEASDRWVRGVKGDVAVVDSRHPILVWTGEVPFPGYAFPRDDVRTDLLRPTPEGYDLVVGDEVVKDAAWTYPDLPEHIAFAWYPASALDHWYEEDEEVFVHPRDPYSRVDPIQSSRHVRVEIAGQVVAETRRPVLLFETKLPTRYYVPPEDVRFDLLEPTDSHTRCPYKGVASYWSFRGEGVPKDIAWAYPDPVHAAAAIKDHVSFYNEAVDIIVDGERRARPVTPFSARLSQS